MLAWVHLVSIVPAVRQIQIAAIEGTSAMKTSVATTTIWKSSRPSLDAISNTQNLMIRAALV